MRIAYLSTFYPLRGGIAQYNASLKRAFERQGHEVKAFTFSRQYPDLLFPGQTQYVGAGEKADKVESVELLDTINPLSWLKTARQIRAFEPDILLMKYWMWWFAPSLGSVASRMLPKTKVISVLDNVISHERRFFDKPLTNWFLKRNDGFLVMSEKVRNDLLQLRPEAPHFFHAHPLYDHFGEAADSVASRKELTIEAGKKVLLFFGFIRAYKGLDLLIEAMQYLDDSYILLAAGESYEDIEKYKSLIRESPAAKRILLHDRYISDADTATYFAASDACILPYKSATQSGIALIAYHFGLPLIATDVGGLKEYIDPDKTGILVDKPDAKALAAGIEKYFKLGGRTSFAAQMDANRDAMSWEHLAESMIGFYRKL